MNCFRFAVFAIPILTIMPVCAELTVGTPFCDHAVLQRGRPVVVWGEAHAGREVRVSFAGQTKLAVAGQDGRWRIILDALKASEAGRELRVSSGKESKVVSDVVVGEVWYMSGQSNVVLPFTAAASVTGGSRCVVNGALESAFASDRQVRLFSAEQGVAASPRRENGGTWTICCGDALRDQSYLAYAYARLLRDALQVPVGVLVAAVGDTRIEGWTSESGFCSSPDANYRALSKAPVHEKPQSDSERRGMALYHQPRVLFNKMTAPLLPMTVRGVVWYQGESNVTEGRYHTGKMHALYAGLKEGFENPRLPFLYAQIAPFDYTAWKAPCFGAETLFNFWLAQARFEEEEPNAAMAVLNDLGEQDNIHPPDKRTVALRLAALALSRVYGNTSVKAEHPRLRSAKSAKDGSGRIVARLRFDRVGAWVARGSGRHPFEVLDGVAGYVPAHVAFHGEELDVWADGVKPVKVRYFCEPFGVGKIINSSGIPLPAFETAVPFSVGSDGGETEVKGRCRK